MSESEAPKPEQIDFGLGDESAESAESGAESGGGSEGDGGTGVGRDGVIGALRSTEPDVSPGDMEGAADLDADPMDHVACFAAKVSGAGGLEAWMHLVIALLIVTLDERDSDGESDDGEGEGIAPPPDM